MEGLNEISTTGAPAIVTLLGLGTVFSCLILLYVMTRMMGSGLPRLLALRDSRKSVGALPTVREDEVAEGQSDSKVPEEAIVGAITLVLARHRSARVVPAARQATGEDPWKIAGRLRLLRTR